MCVCVFGAGAPSSLKSCMGFQKDLKLIPVEINNIDLTDFSAGT